MGPSCARVSNERRLSGSVYPNNDGTNRLLSGNFKQPRGGRNNDQAHPPIHPVNYVAPATLQDEERRVYEFVVRRFLACCSEDAKGESTTVEIEYGDETFITNGLLVLQRNYLDVYPYEKWVSSQQLPNFTVGETFEPTEANITEGETTAPGYLTEPELISLMDANGIGTDATMAEHIAKIKERGYVMTQPRAGSTRGDASGARGARGGRGRGRGGRGGQGGGDTGGGGNSVQQFIPTTLGVALIEGYDNVGLDTSLGKPFLRKEMEIKMKEICAGTKSRHDFVHETLEQYREAFVKTQQQVEVLRAVSENCNIAEQGQKLTVAIQRLAGSIFSEVEHDSKQTFMRKNFKSWEALNRKGSEYPVDLGYGKNLWKRSFDSTVHAYLILILSLKLRLPCQRCFPTAPNTPQYQMVEQIISGLLTDTWVESARTCTGVLLAKLDAQTFLRFGGLARHKGHLYYPPYKGPTSASLLPRRRGRITHSHFAIFLRHQQT